MQKSIKYFYNNQDNLLLLKWMLRSCFFLSTFTTDQRLCWMITNKNTSGTYCLEAGGCNPITHVTIICLKVLMMFMKIFLIKMLLPTNF